MTDRTPRTAIVTGAGQGLGRVYASHLAGMGLRVVVADLNARRAEDVASSIRDSGADALACGVDVSEEQSVASMVSHAVNAFGSVDVLVNNAAIFSSLSLKPFENIPVAEWDQVMAVNVRGPFLCSQQVAPHMRAGEWGRIVNIASAVVRLGVPSYLHYVASKAALIGMTRSLARELGPGNITVNVLSPGGTVTEIPRESISEAAVEMLIDRQSLKRASQPQDLASVIGFLVSDDSAFMTGQELVVDGGLTFG